MNFDFAEEVNTFIEKQDFAGAIALAEAHMNKVGTTEFHEIIGKSLLEQSESVIQWIDELYFSASKENAVAALYFEFTEFDINQEVWEIDGFAYDIDGGFNDFEWLSDVQNVAESFPVTGYEKLQDAFSNYQNIDEEVVLDLEFARDWCEQLVITRFAELMINVHQVAKQKGLAWASTPLYFTEHAYDFVMKSA